MTHPTRLLPVVALVASTVACSSGDRAERVDAPTASTTGLARPAPPVGAEAISLLGDTLVSPRIPAATLAVYQA